MLVETYSCAILGVEAIKVTVEVNVSKGNHQFISGLPDTAVKESLARMESAINNSGFKMPNSKIVWNLGPADIKKTGSSHDLAMAVALLAATQQIHNKRLLSEYLLTGELQLSGNLASVKGALSIAILAWKEGFKGLIVPFENAEEAALVTKIPVYGFRSLEEVANFFNGTLNIEPVKVNTRDHFYSTQYEFDIDMADVKGNERVKRSLEIAAAGGHNTLLIGPPGSGKSMLAKRLPTILPPLTLQEALETTRIYSACGKIADLGSRLVSRRPFRSPLCTSSHAALVGGGSIPVPGEISLSHNGILFLDELAEFNRSVLESLRQPMEDKKVTISRSMRTIDFPSSFMLVAAMNPCPCGYLNHGDVACKCSGYAIEKYMGKISGPLLDRIDLHVEVAPIASHHFLEEADIESSASVRERVINARLIQTARFENEFSVYCNAHMNSKQLKQYCFFTPEAKELLGDAMRNFKFSVRAHDKILKISRTIADLENNSEMIKFHHVSEAIGYRTLDREQWVKDADKKYFSTSKRKQKMT